MPSLLDATARDALRQRSLTLRPDTRAKWGRFTAPQMLSHVIQSLRVMVGEVEMPLVKTSWAIRHAPLRQLLIYVLPFPKGLPTSPVLLERSAADPSSMTADAWNAELQEFSKALDRVAPIASQRVWPSHAAFGAMSGREWGVLQYRHLDHHFRQFGL